MQKIECMIIIIRYTEIAIIFEELKYVLSKKILKNNDFAGLNLTVAANEDKKAHSIILHLYKSNT